MTEQSRERGPSEERMAELREQLRQNVALVEQMPGDEGEIVRDALRGLDVYSIAQRHEVSEDAVWRALGSAVQSMTGGISGKPVETGGLGADTDPGVTGGYGDTGFGSLGNETPEPIPDEPHGPDTWLGGGPDAAEAMDESARRLAERLRKERREKR